MVEKVLNGIALIQFWGFVSKRHETRGTSIWVWQNQASWSSFQCWPHLLSIVFFVVYSMYEEAVKKFPQAEAFWIEFSEVSDSPGITLAMVSFS